MAKDKDGKLTYEMKSPGDAWMDHVEKHHGASAVTPAYLKPEEKSGAVRSIEKRMVELQKRMDGSEKEQAPDVSKPNEKGKEKERGKQIGLSR